MLREKDIRAGYGQARFVREIASEIACVNGPLGSMDGVGVELSSTPSRIKKSEFNPVTPKLKNYILPTF